MIEEGFVFNDRYRIDITRWYNEVTKDWKPDERHESQDYIDNMTTLLDELERCYEEVDKLKRFLRQIELNCKEAMKND